MTETTDNVQELNEQDLQNVTGGLKWFGNTAQDYKRYGIERQVSMQNHIRKARTAGAKGDLATYQKEFRAADESEKSMHWADRKARSGDYFGQGLVKW